MLLYFQDELDDRDAHIQKLQQDSEDAKHKLRELEETVGVRVYNISRHIFDDKKTIQFEL